MIYPIVAYGDVVLKKKAQNIDQTSSEINLPKLIADMYETMYQAGGVGLAAPQIVLSLRLFVVDAEAMDEENLKGFKKVFINPVITKQTGEKWAYNEGCLSIPNIREDVERPFKIEIEYYDANWNLYQESYEGLAARVIQHEYDHIEGVLFIDYLTPFKKRLLKGRLTDISKGNVDVDYRMKFPSRK